MYLAMSSRPWIVPASARYELVDMIASGLSNTRESTSPGRMPPRARHRIWSNCQPEAWILSASRSISMWYSSQETYRCLPSSVSIVRLGRR